MPFLLKCYELWVRFIDMHFFCHQSHDHTQPLFLPPYAFSAPHFNFDNYDDDDKEAFVYDSADVQVTHPPSTTNSSTKFWMMMMMTMTRQRCTRLSDRFWMTKTTH